MNIHQRKDEAISELLTDIKEKTKDKIIKIRKQEQAALCLMTEEILSSGKSLCDNESLLVKSLVVDELLIIEKDMD